MTVHSAPFYWVTCDHEDCGARAPHADDETVAWESATSAVQQAEYSEWLIVGTKHYCEEHREEHEQELPIPGQEPLPIPIKAPYRPFCIP